MAFKYRWKCSACDTTNEPNHEFCKACECPAVADREVLDQWRHSNELGPTILTTEQLDLNNITQLIYPCNYCHQDMYVSDSVCPYCHTEMKPGERSAKYKLLLDKRLKFHKNQPKPIMLGLLAIVVIALIIIIVSQLTGTDIRPLGRFNLRD